MSKEKKSIGSAIDEIVAALTDLEESSRVIAVRAACDHLGITLGQFSQSVREAAPAAQLAVMSGGTEMRGAAPQDIRSLKEEKNPANGVEMACLVAYYLQNIAVGTESSIDVGKTELEKYFKQANFPLPKVPLQTLVDAKSAGYLDSSSRGRYKLNPVGHNLIAHSLPRKKK